MSTLPVLSYASDHDVISQFEQAVRHSALRYSMRHLALAGVTTPEHLAAALERSMRICSYAGIHVAHHFRQIFVWDEQSGSLGVDWLMSSKGFRLVLMQYPEMNEELARWMWQLADTE